MENTDEAYYPGTVYNLLEEGEDPMAPVDRPPRKVVIQMFGGENLTMPPNPFASAGISATVPSRNLNLGATR